MEVPLALTTTVVAFIPPELPIILNKTLVVTVHIMVAQRAIQPASPTTLRLPMSESLK